MCATFLPAFLPAQFSIANKRRQGGKVETHSDLDSGREASEVEEEVIAVVRCERNQEQQGASDKRGGAGG